MNNNNIIININKLDIRLYPNIIQKRKESLLHRNSKLSKFSNDFILIR